MFVKKNYGFDKQEEELSIDKTTGELITN